MGMDEQSYQLDIKWDSMKVDDESSTIADISNSGGNGWSRQICDELSRGDCRVDGQMAVWILR